MIPYRQHPGVNQSTLKTILRAPKLYRHAVDNPSESTAAMQLGTLVHCLLLEPDAFSARYVEIPEGVDFRTKEGKALRDDALATGRDAVKFDELAKARAMVAALLANKQVAYIVENGRLEYAAHWTDHETGISCKALLDCVCQLPSGQWVVFDLKTTAGAADRDSFARAVETYGYHFQAAWYCEAAKNSPELGAISDPSFLFGVVEKEAPHLVGLHAMSPLAIEAGHSDCRRALAILQECQAKNEWPDLAPSTEFLDLPGYAKKRYPEIYEKEV